jgi:hypothetical protein
LILQADRGAPLTSQGHATPPCSGCSFSDQLIVDFGIETIGAGFQVSAVLGV